MLSVATHAFSTLESLTERKADASGNTTRKNNDRIVLRGVFSVYYVKSSGNAPLEQAPIVSIKEKNALNRA